MQETEIARSSLFCTRPPQGHRQGQKRRGVGEPGPSGAPEGRLCPTVPDEVVEYLFDVDPEDEPGPLPTPPVSLLPVVLVLCEFDDPLDEGIASGVHAFVKIGRAHV